MQPSSRWDGIGTVALIYLLTRVAFYLAALLASYMLPEAPEQAARVDVNGRLPLAMHWRWDAIHYYTVSNDGYDDGGTPAFFPLFPVLLRIGGTILGGFRSPAALPIQESERWPLATGVLIAHLAAFAAFFLLYRLARETLGDRDAATRTLLYAAVYPWAFHYATPYTEGLFLALSVGAFLAMRRQNWLLAGVCIGLATATRSTGVLLVPVLALELFLVWRRGQLPRPAWPRAALGLLLAPSGLLLFMAHLWWRIGDPLAFVDAQAQWGRERTFPLETLRRGIDYALHPSWTAIPDVYARGLVHLTFVLAFIIIAAISIYRRWWEPSWTLYGGLLLLMVLSSPVGGPFTMHDMGRYLMVCFPLYLTLAHWGRNPAVHLTILLLFVPLYALFTALYVRWYAV